jgi:signal transduction histidine kinase
MSQTHKSDGPADPPHVDSTHEERVRPLGATFRNILLVVLLILVFAVVQMFMLRRVCNDGMRAATSLESQGLPTLNSLASLQEHLAIFRLNAYEYLFSRESEREDKAKAMAAVAALTKAELVHIRTLFLEGRGKGLASKLEAEFAELDEAFRKAQSFVNSDFAAAMTVIDHDIPPRIQRVSAAADDLRRYGYQISGAEANATFGSFGWIKANAVMFGTANILVALGAVIFVLLAARRSHAQVSETLARLDERTFELAGSLSLVNATLEATADGILLIDSAGRIGTHNQQFLRMWPISDPASVMQDQRALLAFIQPLLKRSDKLSDTMQPLASSPESESFDVLELTDDRVFECCSKPHRLQDRICGRVWSFRDVSEQKSMEREVERTHQQLLLASRQAGMAEVATGVLHNVGNVLNSVNISTTLLIEGLAQSKISNVGRLGELLTLNADNLGVFVTTDASGRQLPAYVNRLSERLNTERNLLLKESELIRKNIDHIKDIVAMQQNYAKAFGVVEKTKVTDLIEDALRLNAGALARHAVEVIRDYQAPDSEITVEKHKVLQILVNLIRNAKYACDESERSDKKLTVRCSNGQNRIRIEVADNGIGIPAQNLTRIFNHGFTTRKTGHGFGLHSAALAAQEMGGSLVARSEGVQQGASLVLDLPLNWTKSTT